MTGIFESSKWDVDAASEVLERQMFGENPRKFSKAKKKRDKMKSTKNPKPLAHVLQKCNKIFPSKVKEKIQASKISAGNKLEPNAVANSTHRLKRTLLNKAPEIAGHGKGKRKKRKKLKVDCNENSYIQLPNNSPVVHKKIFNDQSRLASVCKQSSTNNCVSNAENVTHITENISPIKKLLKTKDLNPLKRNMYAEVTSAKYEVPAKKQRTVQQDVCYSKGGVKKNREVKRIFKDVNSVQKGKVKTHFQKSPKGIVNEAFSDTSVLDPAYSGGFQSELKRNKFLENKNFDGIVNEAFSDESNVKEDSLNHNHHLQKQRQKRKQHKQKTKENVNVAFSDELDAQDDPFSHGQQVSKQVKRMKGCEQKTEGIVNEAFNNDQSNVENHVPIGLLFPELVRTPSSGVVDNIQNSQRLTRKNRYSGTLRERMLAKLKASRFRYLNEQIYTSDSSDIYKYFSSDKNSFLAYHEGFKHQVSQWPLNPLDRIIGALKKKPNTLVIADFGCGDARLARSLPNVVHSFDVVALSEVVTECDMAHTPLKDSSVDVAVFCLSLMGRNLIDYLLEANRILKVGGQLKIAEVESRFKDVNGFIHCLKKFGFSNILKDFSHNMFYFLYFRKVSKPVKRNHLPEVPLKPCLYKKR